MVSASPLMLLALALPVLVIAASLLLAQNAATGARQQATGGALAVCLLCALAMLLAAGTLSVNTVVAAALAMLAGTLIASPLLDRARFYGLLLAAAGGGIAVTLIVSGAFLPILPMMIRPALLYSTLIAALTMGCLGSIILPLHPARVSEGALRQTPSISGGVTFFGWVLLAVIFSIFLWMMLPPNTSFPLPMLIASITAALVTLATTRRTPLADGLQKAGEALVAGLVLAAIAPVGMAGGAVLGLLAGFFVRQSEAIAFSIRLDDPSHLMGALLLPAIAGFLLPGLMSPPLLALFLVWLGAAMALGCVLAAILWPLSMLLCGFALPARLVKEGIR